MLIPNPKYASSIRLKPKNNKLIGQTLDLKISHKIKIYPNQIRIIQWIKKGTYNGTPGGIRNGFYDVQDNVSGQYRKLSYYEIARYYLGKSFAKYSIKGNRISVAPFQITSNPVVPYSQLYTRKFDVLGRVRRRMWQAEGLTEEQMKAKEEEIKNRPVEHIPGGTEFVLYKNEEGEE